MAAVSLAPAPPHHVPEGPRRAGASAAERAPREADWEVGMHAVRPRAQQRNEKGLDVLQPPGAAVAPPAKGTVSNGRCTTCLERMMKRTKRRSPEQSKNAQVP